MFISAPPESSETTRVYESSAASQGFVMNLTRAWAWRPEVFDGFAALRNQLSSQSSLSKRDLAVLVCATASELGDAYCALAWGRTLTEEAGAACTAAVIAGDAQAGDSSARDLALAGWARKVVRNPNATTPDDVAALRSAGLDDKTIFEATTFIAFRLAFSTVNDALGVLPDAELLQQVQPAVRAAVTFGRQPAV